jgi:hypothetical protein
MLPGVALSAGLCGRVWKMSDSYYENLKIGQHVIFHDDRQKEIAGTVKEREDQDGYIRYLLELDSGGLYVAKLPKQQAHNAK